jgi:hypothetical protein
MNVLDLFSGIGGVFCRRVLAKHWPHVPIYEDIRMLSAIELIAAGIKPDLICGGFPCQDISLKCIGSSSNADRLGLSLRTFLACELSASTKCLMTWKAQDTPLRRRWWWVTPPGASNEPASTGDPDRLRSPPATPL